MIAHAFKPPNPKRSAPMQHPAIIKHNCFALAQLMRMHGSGCLDKSGEARERIVELVRCVEREGCLEKRAAAHGASVVSPNVWSPRVFFLFFVCAQLCIVFSFYPAELLTLAPLQVLCPLLVASLVAGHRIRSVESSSFPVRLLCTALPLGSKGIIVTHLCEFSRLPSIHTYHFLPSKGEIQFF